MIIFITISVILIAASWFIGDQKATTKIENEKVTYEEIIQKVNDKEKELQRMKGDVENAQSNYESVSADLSKVSDDYKEVQGIIAEKEKLQAELDELKRLFS